MNQDMLDIFKFWVKEREHIRKCKDGGAPNPWTDDAILQQFKFCNVSREDDRVTRWFRDNWRHERYWGEKNFVPAIILGRTINWPDTLSYLGFPQVWDREDVLRRLNALKATGRKIYTGAYMVTQYGSIKPKNELVTDNADLYFTAPPKILATLEDTWVELQQFPGIGSFMAGQVVADLKRTRYLEQAKDWYDWAALGPGSMRGLNRLYDRPINYSLAQDQGLMEMRELYDASKFTLCMQDLQNCLCEFDKYVRVLSGQGTPRSRYQGA